MFRSGAVAVAERKPEYARYASCKIDAEVMRVARAAASLAGRSVQDWISDHINILSAKALNRDPIKRKPPPPHPKRPK